jgi:hypothetical protein
MTNNLVHLTSPCCRRDFGVDLHVGHLSQSALTNRFIRACVVSVQTFNKSFETAIYVSQLCRVWWYWCHSQSQSTAKKVVKSVGSRFITNVCLWRTNVDPGVLPYITWATRCKTSLISVIESVDQSPPNCLQEVNTRRKSMGGGPTVISVLSTSNASTFDLRCWIYGLCMSSVCDYSDFVWWFDLVVWQWNQTVSCNIVPGIWMFFLT